MLRSASVRVYGGGRFRARSRQYATSSPVGRGSKLTSLRGSKELLLASGSTLPSLIAAPTAIGTHRRVCPAALSMRAVSRSCAGTHAVQAVTPAAR